MGGLSAAGSLFGGLFGASASEKAAQQYEQAIQQGITSLQGNLQQGEANYSPYIQAGQGATTTLSSLLGTPGQGLLTPWTQSFQAPTEAQAEATPGYQFQLHQGENAMQNSAAGQGSLLTGRTLADLNNLAQGTASTNYQNTFNNALTQYGTAYQSFLNNQNNQYSRLMGLSGEGLQAAGGEGQLLGNIGGDIASLYGQKGAAAAQGTIGAANAYGSILPGMANGMMGGLTLSSLLGNGGGTAPITDFNSSIWMGTPSYMPGGGSSPVAPYSGLNLPQ